MAAELGISILDSEALMGEMDKIKKAIKKGEEEIEEVFTGEKPSEDGNVQQPSDTSNAANNSPRDFDRDGDRLYVKFFDDSSLAPVSLDDDAELQIQASVGKEAVSAAAKLTTDEQGRGQYVSLEKFLEAAAQKITDKDKEETTLLATVALTAGATVGCARYAPAQVAYQMKLVRKGERFRLAEACCNRIPIPVTKLADTCVIRFRAWDASKVDFIENAEAFRSDVKWTVTAVQTALPPTPSTSPTASNTAAPATTVAATSTFQPWTSSVTSEEGVGEIFEVPLNQLYQIVAETQQGYCICEGQAMQYRYICCEREVEIKQYFKPCGVRGVRTAIFIPQNCQVDRWGNGRTVNVGGMDLTIGENGILNIPSVLEGAVLTLSAPNVTFTPAALDATKNAPTVTTFTVTEQAVLASGRTVQARFVDQSNSPFVHRPIWVLLPNGDEIQVETDDQGYFEAPAGSQVYAREDAWGAPTEPVLVS
jgi:hypothetical protein